MNIRSRRPQLPLLLSCNSETSSGAGDTVRKTTATVLQGVPTGKGRAEAT